MQGEKNCQRVERMNRELKKRKEKINTTTETHVILCWFHNNCIIIFLLSLFCLFMLLYVVQLLCSGCCMQISICMAKYGFITFFSYEVIRR